MPRKTRKERKNANIITAHLVPESISYKDEMKTIHVEKGVIPSNDEWDTDAINLDSVGTLSWISTDDKTLNTFHSPIDIDNTFYNRVTADILVTTPLMHKKNDDSDLIMLWRLHSHMENSWREIDREEFNDLYTSVAWFRFTDPLKVIKGTIKNIEDSVQDEFDKAERINKRRQENKQKRMEAREKRKAELEAEKDADSN